MFYTTSTDSCTETLLGGQEPDEMDNSTAYSENERGQAAVGRMGERDSCWEEKKFRGYIRRKRAHSSSHRVRELYMFLFSLFVSASLVIFKLMSSFCELGNVICSIGCL
jgi:hypothetical protein